MAEPGTLTIDVDDPDYDPAREAIESHSLIAKFYKYRPPYTRAYFDALAERLSLTRDSTVLDLCCGRGDLAAGLGAHVGQIQAVDGAPEMIEHAIPVENAKYHVADVNRAPLDAVGRIDHIFVGAAIHWVEREALTRIITQNLVPGGAIVVAHRNLTLASNAAQNALTQLNRQFGDRPVTGDMQGTAKLRACGFGQVDGIQLAQPAACEPGFLFMYQLSKAYYAFYDNALGRRAEYERAFNEAMAPHTQDGRIPARIANWAWIYRAAP
ncbi:MAG: class I SAM-dependent methyltransferase [Sphingomonadaceae bacterium]|jgi:protein-L-isoaspartate O-methyltransferase